MKKYSLIIVFAILFSFNSCDFEKKDKENLNLVSDLGEIKDCKENNKILLINIGSNTRLQIFEIIKLVYQGNAKTIAVNIIFRESKDVDKDLNLFLGNKKNIVFSEQLINNNDFFSGIKNGPFLNANKGFVVYKNLELENKMPITGFINFKIQNGKKSETSFFSKAIESYDPIIYKNLSQNPYFPIQFTCDLGNFNLIKPDFFKSEKLDLNVFKNKLVIIGYFPGGLHNQETVHELIKSFNPLNTTKYNSSLVIANTFLTLLESEYLKKK